MDKTVKTYFLDADNVNIDMSLALRFLRVRGEVDDNTKSMLKSCLEEFLSAVSYKACYRYFDIKVQCDTVCFDDQMKLQSEKLSKNLKGCKGAFVFVATTAVTVDRLIGKYAKLQVSKAVILDAIGSSAVECFCDMLCKKIQSDFDVALRPRFSPGYGDLSIITQSDVLSACDTNRKIGVTLTDNHMMLPKKSVSAIVGVRPKNEECQKASSCEICDSEDCPYRE
ncbi:MAG: hypothetical protein E7513_02570 [Ruminococcaceae bacterium]|nr:hypothetical protein [Oscillospiraceae bacterium]